MISRLGGKQHSHLHAIERVREFAARGGKRLKDIMIRARYFWSILGMLEGDAYRSCIQRIVSYEHIRGQELIQEG